MYLQLCTKQKNPNKQTQQQQQAHADYRQCSPVHTSSIKPFQQGNEAKAELCE